MNSFENLVNFNLDYTFRFINSFVPTDNPFISVLETLSVIDKPAGIDIKGSVISYIYVRLTFVSLFTEISSSLRITSSRKVKLRDFKLFHIDFIDDYFFQSNIRE